MCKCGEHESHEIHLREELSELSRLIILNKILYYYPEKLPSKVHERWQVLDEHYDAMEKRYLIICEELNIPNELVHKEYPNVPEHLNGKGMHEVDFSRIDVQQVLEEFTHKYTR